MSKLNQLHFTPSSKTLSPQCYTNYTKEVFICEVSGKFWKISSCDITFTRDEVDYIVRELYDTIYQHVNKRQNRLTEIKASRKIRQENLARDKMQKLFEES